MAQGAKGEGPEDYAPVFQTPNHPRVGVSWYEAAACCRWLSEKMKGRSSRREEALTSENDGTASPRLLPGEEVRLPSEAERERAARGQKGRRYPWGDGLPTPDHCNWREAGIGSTSAVGVFPEDRAKRGTADLAGDVLEWCRTPWLDNYNGYETKVSEHMESDSARVLPGGSWLNEHPVSSGRYRDDPGGRYRSVGFRVVRVGASAR